IRNGQRGSEKQLRGSVLNDVAFWMDAASQGIEILDSTGVCDTNSPIRWINWIILGRSRFPGPLPSPADFKPSYRLLTPGHRCFLFSIQSDNFSFETDVAEGFIARECRDFTSALPFNHPTGRRKVLPRSEGGSTRRHRQWNYRQHFRGNLSDA